MALLEDVILAPDTRANQPAANTVPVGTLYCVTDESDILERSNGAAWEAYSPGAAGGGTVTNTGTLTADTVILGNGGVDIQSLPNGTAGQVLTMNGGATAPEWAAASGGGFIGYVAYAAGSDTTLHTQSSNTMTEMDSANVVVTFTAPASGNVLVVCSVIHSCTAAAGDCFWGLMEGASTIAEAYMAGPGGSAFTRRTTVQFSLTGVSGGSHTYKLAHRVTTNSVSAFTGPTFGQAIMQVYELS